MRSSVTQLTVLCLLALGPNSLTSAADSFDPETHFPEDSYLYVSADIGGLRRAFSKTPLGTILCHPEIRAGLGALPDMLLEMVRSRTEMVTQMLQMDLFEVLDLFAGRVTLASSMAGKERGAELYLALELGSKKKELVGLVAKLTQFATAMQIMKKETSDARIDEKPVRVFRLQGGDVKLHLAVLEKHLLVVVARDLEPLLARLGKESARGPSRSKSFRRARKSAGMDDPLLVAYLDVKALWGGRETYLGNGPSADILPVWFKALGGTGLASLSCHLGLRDGDWETKILMQGSGPFQGFLEKVVDSCGGPESYEPLARIPLEATRVACFSIDPGWLFRSEESEFLQLTGYGVFLNMAVQFLEQATGQSLAKDLSGLPRLNVYGFQALPPAGGLLPDTIVLLKESEARPYLQVIEKIARGLGSRAREVEVAGKKVSLVRLGGPSGKSSSGSGRPPGIPRPTLSLAHGPADEGWTIVADSPQAIFRYLKSYSQGKKLGDSPEVMKQIGKGPAAARAVALFRGGTSILTAYNSAVDLLHLMSPNLKGLLDTYGVNPALFPPAEVFLPSFRAGFLTLQKSEDEVVIHGHRVLTHLVGDSVTTLIVLAALLAPFA